NLRRPCLHTIDSPRGKNTPLPGKRGINAPTLPKIPFLQVIGHRPVSSRKTHLKIGGMRGARLFSRFEETKPGILARPESSFTGFSLRRRLEFEPVECFGMGILEGDPIPEDPR